MKRDLPEEWQRDCLYTPEEWDARGGFIPIGTGDESAVLPLSKKRRPPVPLFVNAEQLAAEAEQLAAGAEALTPELTPPGGAPVITPAIVAACMARAQGDELDLTRLLMRELLPAELWP